MVCVVWVSSSVLGMRVSWAKTKLQNIGSGVHGQPSNITVDGNTVEQVDNFIIIIIIIIIIHEFRLT